MRSKVKLCNIEGCNSPSWSGGLCKSHGPKTSFLVQSVRRLGKTLTNANYTNQMIFFNIIWDKKPHKSEVSGTYLGREPNTMYFHHILPKSKYPQAMFDEENIILLTPDEHATVEMNSTKYEEVNKRREQLKIKYNLN
tara:strand:+ start:39118 stop:39531 length:414 start_codon:yes stop_codon:yes gene_type:complete